MACLSLSIGAAAQGDYEIQVYGSELVSPGATMVELHSNYTISGTHALSGSQFAEDRTEPTTGAVHETVEITHGFNDWFETGFYIFTSAHSGFGYEWVGEPHSSAGCDSGKMALARWIEPIERDRLLTSSLFARHMDLGDSSNYRQATWAMVFVLQSDH